MTAQILNCLIDLSCCSPTHILKNNIIWQNSEYPSNHQYNEIASGNDALLVKTLRQNIFVLQLASVSTLCSFIPAMVPRKSFFGFQNHWDFIIMYGVYVVTFERYMDNSLNLANFWNPYLRQNSEWLQFQQIDPLTAHDIHCLHMLLINVYVKIRFSYLYTISNVTIILHIYTFHFSVCPSVPPKKWQRAGKVAKVATNGKKWQRVAKSGEKR